MYYIFQNTKKLREQYLIGNFKDFTGEIRDYVLCLLTGTHNLDGVGKEVSIGLSVCNHGDKFDDKIGKKIAKRKACYDELCLEWFQVYRNCTINTEVANSLLKSYAEYFENDPGMFIEGYNEEKEEYLKDPNRWIAKRNFKLQKEKDIAELEKELEELKNKRFI